METTEKFSDKKLTRSEVAEKLLPVIDLHGIEVKENCIEFPGSHPYAGALESELPGEDTPAVIYFDDIASISSFEVRIEVLLVSGELYTFSTTDNTRTHINTYKPADEILRKRPITPQDIAKNMWDGLDDALSKGLGK